MKIFLAGTYSRDRLFREEMPTPKYILESFYYVKPWQMLKIHEWDMFLLDSGAFTFMTSLKNQTVKWDEYVERYADFINRNNINHFFELDIDSVVGLKEVERLRAKLERLTGKQSIPVWHKTRGKDYYLKMCDEYKYVALGGIVSKEFKQVEHKYFPWFINTAHSKGAKIHGLGYTNLNGLTKYHFDSVDSTSWLSASRFGQLHYFDGRTIKQRCVSNGEHTVHYQKMDDFVFKEWVKYQLYADKCL